MVPRHYLLCAAVLSAGAVGSAVLISQTGDADLAIAEAVIAGCRAREEASPSIEFSCIVDHFTGARMFPVILDVGVAPEDVEKFVGSQDAARGRLIEHYRLRPDEWEVEARALRWAGVGGRFSGDVSRSPTQVGDLHMKSLDRPDMRLEFAAGPNPSFPRGYVLGPFGPWALKATRQGEYLGLCLTGLGGIADHLASRIKDGASVSSETVTHEGRDGIVLVLRQALPTSYRVLRMGFVKLDGYAPFVVEGSFVYVNDDGTEALAQVFAAWEGYTQAPDGSWVPERFRSSKFSRDGSGLGRLEYAWDVTIDKDSLAEAGPRLGDQALASWFPLGTLVMVAPDVRDLLPPAMLAKLEHDTGLATLPHPAVGESMDDWIYHMGDPLYTGDVAKRREAASEMVERVKHDAALTGEPG